MRAKRNSILFTWGIIFTILNLWLWNPQLPLVNYAINNNRIMLIQVVHVILNIGMTFMLLKLGQLFVKTKPSLVNLINSWILVIILGLLEVLIQLLWKNQFQFSDLLNSLFPLSRNVIPVVMGIILSRCLVSFYAKLKLSSRHQIGALLLAGLFASTIFNANLWGFDNSYNLVLTMIIVSVGALLSDLKLQLNQRMLKISVGGVLLLNLLLAAVMPKISVSVHNDFSSATRFANPSNVLTIMVALGLCYIFTKQLDFRFANTMLISIAFASYPILMNLFTSSIVNHFPHATLRYGVMLICAIILLPISYCGLRLLDLISKTEWYDRYHKTIAGFRTFTDIKTFLLQHWKQHAHQYLAIAFFYLLAIVSLLAMDNSLKLTPNVNYTYNTLIYTFCNKQSIIIFTAFLIWLMFKLFQSITNSFWWGIGITTMINIIWIIANRIKIGARNEPIMPSEMIMYQAYGSILKMVNPWLLVGAAIVIVVACLVIWRFNRKTPFMKLSIKARGFYIILTILVYGSALFWNHQGSPIQTVVQGMGVESYPFNQLSGARVNGPIIQFMSNVDVKVMDQPTGYSKATMSRLAKKYQLTAKQINQHRQNNLSDQTIVLNLSESFATPNRVPGVHLKNDPIPYINSLKKKTTSGLMISSGYGGGTANMEYMSLTGLTLANFTPTLATPFT